MKKLTQRTNINEVVNETIFQFPSIKFVSKIEERCKERGITLRDLSNLSGVRYPTVSDLKNAKKPTLNLQNTIAIMVALRLESLDDLFGIEFEDSDDAEKYAMESAYYSSKGLPDSALERMEDNKIRLGR